MKRPTNGELSGALVPTFPAIGVGYVKYMVAYGASTNFQLLWKKEIMHSLFAHTGWYLESKLSLSVRQKSMDAFFTP